MSRIMERAFGPQRPAGLSAASGTHEGVVVSTSPGGLFVRLDGFDPNLKHGPCPDAYGARPGDRCLVAFSPDGEPWIVSLERKAGAGTQVRDVGSPGQIRAGRQLTVQDFLDCGLGIPRALWNLTDLTDASGNGVTLTAGGTTSPVAAKGITGTDGEARFFSGQGATPPFLSAPNSIKQGYGTWGCAFQTSKRDINQMLMAMFRVTADFSFELYITPSNTIQVDVDSDDGNSTSYWFAAGSSVVTDGRWHFVKFSWDGSKISLMLDGTMEALGATAFGSPSIGPMYTGGTALLYLGSRQINGLPLFGTIDEAFVTSDIISLEQHRYLMAAKVPHGASLASRISVSVNRRKRTSIYTTQDFTDLGLAPPLVGYNFFLGALGNDDYGSLGRDLSPIASPTEAPDVDGRATGSVNLNGTSQYFSASGAGLPGTTAPRTIGIWMKAALPTAANAEIIAFGTTDASDEYSLFVLTSGLVFLQNGVGAVLTGSYVADRNWHFITAVGDGGTPADGLKNKLYVDGVLVGSTTNFSNGPASPATLTIGTRLIAGALFFPGQIATAFICGEALSSDHVRVLYNKPGLNMGDRSPVDPVAAIVERFTDTHAYIIVPDDIPGTDYVELVAS